jgi:hypothetical protein
VKASIDRIVAEAKAMRDIGIGTIAIMFGITESAPVESRTDIALTPASVSNSPLNHFHSCLPHGATNCLQQLRFAASSSGVKPPQALNVLLKRGVDSAAGSAFGLRFVNIGDENFSGRRCISLRKFGMADSNRPGIVWPPRVAIEKSDKHVAVTRLLHAMIPSLLAAIFSRLLIDPHFKNRLSKNSDRLNFCL